MLMSITEYEKFVASYSQLQERVTKISKAALSYILNKQEKLTASEIDRMANGLRVTISSVETGAVNVSYGKIQDADVGLSSEQFEFTCGIFLPSGYLLDFLLDDNWEEILPTRMDVWQAKKDARLNDKAKD